jgi:hypothetical protein
MTLVVFVGNRDREQVTTATSMQDCQRVFRKSNIVKAFTNETISADLAEAPHSFVLLTMRRHVFQTL